MHRFTKIVLKYFPKEKGTNKSHHSWQINLKIWNMNGNEWYTFQSTCSSNEEVTSYSCSLYMWTTRKENCSFHFLLDASCSKPLPLSYSNTQYIGSITANKNRTQLNCSRNFNDYILLHLIQLEVWFGEDRHLKVIKTTCNSHATLYYLILLSLSGIQLLQDWKFQF